MSFLGAIKTFVLDIVSISDTGGPRYSRTFYMRPRLQASQENIPKFIIRGLSLAYLWHFEKMMQK